jgi:hypothetical protein
MRIREFIVDLTKDPEDRFEEIGKIYGKILRVLLKRTESAMFSGCEALVAPILKKALKMACEFVRDSLGEHEYMQELEGLSRHAKVDVNDLVFANVVYDFTAAFKIPGIGCTGFVHGGPDNPLIARAMDWCIPEGIGSYSMVIRYRAKDYEVLSVGFPGVNGIISGQSSVGLAMTVNQKTKDGVVGVPNWATPTLWRVREVLENSSGYRSARRMIGSQRIASPAFVLMCGVRSGEACLVETDGSEYNFIRVGIGTTQAVANHTPEGNLLDDDFDDATSEERYIAMKRRAAALGRADVTLAKKALGRWPINCERTVQQMVLCPALGILELKCVDLGGTGYLQFSSL